MEKFRVRLFKFKLRLRACYNILFRKYNHWVILDLDNENIIKLLKDENFDANILYHGLQPYNVYKIIQMVGNSKDDVEMLCYKAEFEANAAEYSKSK